MEKNDIVLEPVIDNSIYKSFAGVKFVNATRAYFFGVKDIEVKLGDIVVVDTARGMEIGTIAVDPQDISEYKSNLGLKPIIRIATKVDIKCDEINKKDAKFAIEVCNEEIKRLNLNMDLLSCEYTLDKSKVIFSYLAEERVDFRELLKVLASKLHTRIELRQIGARDRAKMTGGLGVCGLPLCCSSFLNEFDGISIGRAKNQMLAINIPKLSGQCGKLICCLKFEDDAYTDGKKNYPELGSKLVLDKQEYTLTSINIISGQVKIENPEDVKFMLYTDLIKDAKFLKKGENSSQIISDETESKEDEKKPEFIDKTSNKPAKPERNFKNTNKPNQQNRPQNANKDKQNNQHSNNGARPNNNDQHHHFNRGKRPNSNPVNKQNNEQK